MLIENDFLLQKMVLVCKIVYISTVSIPAGLWRAQLDHIITHLKAHATSSHEFQDSIGYYQLGKVSDKLYFCHIHCVCMYTCSYTAVL